MFENGRIEVLKMAIEGALEEHIEPLSHVLRHIKQILRLIYSKELSDRILSELKKLMDFYRQDSLISLKRTEYEHRDLLSEKDAILITYANTICREEEKPLVTLHRFLDHYIRDAVTGIHLLPFFPSSSDAGYAVIDYKEVDPALGTWEDVKELAQDYRLTLDLVLNHVSSKSKWFQGFLNGDRRYSNYFIWSDKKQEMPEVFRPRETPLFTKFDTAHGQRWVWTTFGADQIDLNYRNPAVLLSIVDVMLFYLSQGAGIIRLDAVGYVWKEPHTSCVNLSKTHQIVRFLRSVLEYVAPYALILTEANFPYKENIAYFGERHEAQMVYRFSLPPLVLDAFSRRDTSYIKKITNRKRQDLLFFDFLASHDGIALLAAKEILSEEEFEGLLKLTKIHGGLVSSRSTKRGEQPYELNISYFDAINDPNAPGDPFSVERFIASQAIMLTLKGVPGVYVHSLLGSQNNLAGVKETGISRMINREKLQAGRLEASLSEARSLRGRVLSNFLHLLNVRKKIRAFHPSGTRKVLDSDRRLLIISRGFRGENIRVVINVSEDQLSLHEYVGLRDLLTGKPFGGKVESYGVYLLPGISSQ
jgi:glycosidase